MPGAKLLCCMACTELAMFLSTIEVLGTDKGSRHLAFFAVHVGEHIWWC